MASNILFVDLNLTSTSNIIVDKLQLESTRNHAMIYAQDENANGRFFRSITLSLLGLHQVAKDFLLTKLNKLDIKGIILKE